MLGTRWRKASTAGSRVAGADMANLVVVERCAVFATLVPMSAGPGLARVEGIFGEMGVSA